jgi:3-hydroxy-9,10-secoandrosta-1,3,5(10)-triene-9,17-dione monooxygenase reductase component
MSQLKPVPQDFRRVLGQFATGVTIVTTRAPDGTPCGVTASSFNSVSLDPPMVLWSLGRQALSMAAFAAAEHFTVHVLAADQQALSNRFASRGSDKFAGLAWADDVHGVPLLPGCAAVFRCRTAHRYDGGDHVIFVGEVLGFESADCAPLLFHGGRYAALMPQPQPALA